MFYPFQGTSVVTVRRVCCIWYEQLEQIPHPRYVGGTVFPKTKRGQANIGFRHQSQHLTRRKARRFKVRILK